MTTIKETKLSSFEDFHPFARTLSRGGIKTVEDLICSTPDEVLKIRDIGDKKLKAICQWMKNNGLNFI